MKILFLIVSLLCITACEPRLTSDNPAQRFQDMPKPAVVTSVTKNNYYEWCTMVVRDANGKYNFFYQNLTWCGFKEGQIIQ